MVLKLIQYPTLAPLFFLPQIECTKFICQDELSTHVLRSQKRSGFLLSLAGCLSTLLLAQPPSLSLIPALSWYPACLPACVHVCLPACCPVLNVCFKRYTWKLVQKTWIFHSFPLYFVFSSFPRDIPAGQFRSNSIYSAAGLLYVGTCVRACVRMYVAGLWAISSCHTYMLA